jgi:hypothetical protein
MANKGNSDQDKPKPHVALKRLQPLIGTWKMVGHPLGSKTNTITGTTTYKWLHKEEGNDTGFFLQQDMDMNYAGMPIKSHEIIGYNPKTKAFSSYVFQNLAPDPWPYEWDLRGGKLTISVKYKSSTYGQLDSSFHGEFLSDDEFSGGWRPNPGADETINASYDIIGTRVK